MSGFLKSQDCSKVGYEESMWMTVSDDQMILIAAHIDDFIISCAHRPTLNKFKNALLRVLFVHTLVAKLSAICVMSPLCFLRNIMLKTFYALSVSGTLTPFLLTLHRIPA